MSGTARRINLIVGVLLVVFGGYSAWRAAHPPLSDPEQIAVNLEAARSAIENRNARGVTGFLSRDFSYGGMKRSDINNQMVAAFVQMRDVKLTLLNVQTNVSGDTATTKGRYVFSSRRAEGSAPESSPGPFTLTWAKRDGNWEITKADIATPPGL